LCAVFFFRAVGPQRQRGAAGKEKIPAHTQEKQRQYKLVQLHAGERDGNAQQIEHYPHAHDGQGAKAFDQVAGKKPRRKHADDMPLQHQRRIVKAQATLLHGQRSRGHQQVHDAIAQCRTDAGYGKHGLAHDGPQAASPGGLALSAVLCGKLHKCHQDHGQQRHDGQCDVSACKWHLHQGARACSQIGSGHSAYQPTCQYQRHRLFAECGQGQLGCRKAVQLAIGAVVAGHHGGDHQPPELPLSHRPRAQHGRCHSNSQSDLKRDAPPVARLRFGNQRRGQCATYHVAHHR